MAIKITEECINCGACEPECPNNAIYEGGVEWAISDGTTVKGTFTLWMVRWLMLIRRMLLLAVDTYYIIPNKCTECQGFHEEPNVQLFARLIAVCLMKCTRKQLMNYWQKKKNCIFNRVIMCISFQHN